MIIVTEKKCKTCGETKSTNEFPNIKRNADGLSGSCKVCYRAKQKAYYDPEKTKQRHEKYRSNPINKIKELILGKNYREKNREEINRKHRERKAANKDKIRKYLEANKERLKEYRKEYHSRPEVKERHKKRVYEWREKNPDKVREIQRKRRKKYPEKYRAYSNIGSKNYINRKRGAEGRYTLKEWNQLCEMYGNVCLCCKQPKKLEADHVIPISKGGSNTIDNIQPLCRTCNAKKNNKFIDYRPTALSSA